MNITNAELQRIRDWAQERINDGSEPPWAWYQYMKLRETLDAILAGRGATTRLVTEDGERVGEIEVVMPM